MQLKSKMERSVMEWKQSLKGYGMLKIRDFSNGGEAFRRDEREL